MKFIADIRDFSSAQSRVGQQTLFDIGLEKYMIPNGQDTAHKFVDFNSRDFTVNQPIILSYTDISLLERTVLDYSKLATSMDRWYVLFDPAASLVETQGYGYKGEENGVRVEEK